MRYLVKYYNGVEIINDLRTNSLDEALTRERELRLVYGRENAWFADSVMEILVG